MKAKSLKHEGPSAWIWTGAYQVPCPTITGDIGKEPMSERQKINGGIFEEIASSQAPRNDIRSLSDSLPVRSKRWYFFLLPQFEFLTREVNT